jgi:NADH-quinone oxidoreductase subunit L
LLIGFWFHKPEAAAAGKKAFLVNRVGDFGFALGVFLIWTTYGTLNFHDTTAASGATVPGVLGETRLADPNGFVTGPVATAIGLLLLLGACGKSAQVPLHVWLPDAMEGPTPVSSVLHSATMVAAGVYLLARVFPFYAQSADAMTFALAIGTITMLLSSTMGMVASDIKQVWAYSTISQLGFMIMGLAAGAYTAGVFHLTTHAAFKCLLFNAAGTLIHTYHTNDFFVMSEKGARSQKVPVYTMTIAACALAGLPGFGGFFSKEAIIAGLEKLDNPIWLIAGLVGAAMTAYYTFRVIFVLWRPASEVMPYAPAVMAKDAHGHDAHGGHHGTPAVMAIPLIALAVFAVVLGYVGQPLQRFLMGDASVARALEHLGGMGGHGAEAAVHHGGGLLAAIGIHVTPMLFIAIGVALSGVALAWMDWGRKGCKRVGFLHAVPGLEELFRNKWYFDDMYRWLLDNVIYGIFSRACIMHDRRVIDGGVDGVVGVTVGGGRVLSFIQFGLVQYNFIIVFTVVGGLALYLLFG